MRSLGLFAFSSALLAATTMSATIVTAQTPNPLQQRPAVRQIPQPTSTTPTAPVPTPDKAAKAKTAPSGDFKARRTQCSQEWKTAKANNTTGGDKWPQFFSKCNTRLKAQGV